MNSRQGARVVIGAMTALLAGNAAAYDNIVTELYGAAYLDPEHQQVVDLQDGTAQKSGSWAISVVRGDATSSASASGTATVHASAAVEEIQSGYLITYTSASVWAGDVLYVHVAGATADTLTTLNFSGTAKFTFDHPRGGDGEFVSSVQGCIGLACDVIVPDWVLARLALPAPDGVFSPVYISPSCKSSKDALSWTCKESASFVIKGPDAVVPVVYALSIISNPWDYFQQPEQAIIDGSFKWSLKLPKGVTCTSRTGAVSKGLCPKAAPSQPG